MIDPQILDFLPPEIFDIHVHVFQQPAAQLPGGDYRRKFDGVFSAADYSVMAAAELPGKRIYLNVFGMPEAEANCPEADRFTARNIDLERVFGLALVRPDEPATELEKRLRRHRFIGLKPYPALVSGKPVDEVELFDMLSPGQLELANRHGWLIMLHLPRRDRLADPLNQEQLEFWCRNYPRAKFIVAHLGRSYFFRGIENQLDRFLELENLCFDTAMVNHDRVLEYAFRKIDRRRLLFGSDVPIALLLGKSMEVNNQYFYLMGEDYAIGTSLDGRNAPVKFTTFLAEQLAALRTAIPAAGLTGDEIENYFFHNSRRLCTESAQWLN